MERHRGKRRLRFAIFALAGAAFFLSFFHRVAPAALSQDLTREFELSSAALGTLAASYFYVYALMQIPTGVLVDTLGPRRVLTAGGLVSGGGSLLMGVAGSFGAAAFGRTLVGLGVSVAFVSALKLNSVWFDERRFATVTGISTVLGTSGAVAAAAPLAWLVTRVSWRSVFLAAGVASLAVGALVWAVARDGPATAKEPAHEPWTRALSSVLRNRGTWPGFWVNLAMAGPYLSFAGLWGVPYLMSVHGMSSIEAARHTTLMVVSLAVSGAALTALSDRVELRRPFVIASAILYFACWLLWFTGFSTRAGMSYVICAGLGITASGFFLSWVTAKEVSSPRFSGMAVSLVNCGGFLAVGILQPTIGWVLDHSEGPEAAYRIGIGLLAATAFLAVIASFYIPETRCRNVWKEERA
ncbi:MAG TPA: MFS transporter [Vicinamibacteria bacterium]|nr:MFS transporter [Vicinamibacteria bacterium]